MEEVSPQTHVIIEGARVHNLKNVSVHIPHNSLTVVTGLSGSGKSSLVFDVIYAEGQRRYMETLNAYARQFLGNLERPDVDYIDGLAPVIAIEQRTTGRNSRSTVGTITEIYDFLRLLYARVGIGYSPATGEALVSHTTDEIEDLIRSDFRGKRVALCAPLVRGRKGHYQRLFSELLRKGFLYARIDGEVVELSQGMKLDRYSVHDIELILDRLKVPVERNERFTGSLLDCLHRGNGMVLVIDLDGHQSKYYSRHLLCPVSGFTLPNPEPHTFSFNSQYGACPECRGTGVVWGVPTQEYFTSQAEVPLVDLLEQLYGKNCRPLQFVKAWLHCWLSGHGLASNASLAELPEDLRERLFYSTQPEPIDTKLLKKYATLEQALYNDWKKRLDGDPYTDYKEDFYSLEADQILSRPSGLIRAIYEANVNLPSGEKYFEQFYTDFGDVTCCYCNGNRLNVEALAFRIQGLNIAEVSQLALDKFAVWVEGLEGALSEKHKQVASEIIKEIASRVHFLLHVGLGYLSLHRPSNSLSGGESQRIRLATQIGTNLVNVLYILDEPSIGLHPRDNTRLIEALKILRAQENTIIVVEHDEEMMRSADYLIDLGPGAGRLGGNIIASGTPEEIVAARGITSDFLSGRSIIPTPSVRRTGNGQALKLFGARGHNLKNIDVAFPLGRFICVTGVSGSGKSTLVNATLYPILSHWIYKSKQQPLSYARVEGLEYVDKVIRVDQSPLSKNPRSNPATFTGIFTDIRNLFAATQDAKVRGFTARRFSFNVAGGRCERCSGSGYELIEMNFLPDVQVRCSDCGGERYNRETLAVRYKGKNIHQVLEMTVNQAYEFFQAIPSLERKLHALRQVGMGYIKLGQMCATLSGGENQRVRLATELAKRDTGKTVYIFDEPTTGLHFEDVKQLLAVLNALVDRGNTVIVIEHNLDVIRNADYLIDIGLESGEQGGEVIAVGTPEAVAQGKGYTAVALRTVLAG